MAGVYFCPPQELFSHETALPRDFINLEIPKLYHAWILLSFLGTSYSKIKKKMKLGCNEILNIPDLNNQFTLRTKNKSAMCTIGNYEIILLPSYCKRQRNERGIRMCELCFFSRISNFASKIPNMSLNDTEMRLVINANQKLDWNAANNEHGKVQGNHLIQSKNETTWSATSASELQVPAVCVRPQ